MPELEDDVRATAPRPSEAFVTRLEQRVEAGFPRKRRARRAPALWRPGVALAACMVLALVVLVPVLTRPGEDASESSGSSARMAQPAQESVAPGAERRRVEQRTAIELATGADEFSEVTAGVLRVADGTGAIVARSDVSEQGGRGAATYDLRVPASRLDDALARLSGLAAVRSRSTATEDVTATYVSARDRLVDARDERRALLRALERADSEGERSAIRARLRDARDRIATAERAVRRVQARTDRARVEVTVRSTGEQGAWTPGDALDDAGRILQVAAGVVLVVGAVVLPAGLLVAVAIATVRLTRRRRRSAVLG